MAKSFKATLFDSSAWGNRIMPILPHSEVKLKGIWVGGFAAAKPPTQTPKRFLFGDWPSKNQVDAIALFVDPHPDC
jgi:hypothetical protein